LRQRQTEEENHAIAKMTARCAHYMSALKIVHKRKISRRLRKNLHITISLLLLLLLFRLNFLVSHCNCSCTMTSYQRLVQTSVLCVPVNAASHRAPSSNFIMRGH